MTRKSFLMRRARAHPVSSQDLQKYLMAWQTGALYSDPSAFPSITAETLFGRHDPLQIEVGCGTGEFLCDLAQHYPHALFVGTDINLKSLQLAASNAGALGLDNIRFIKAPFQWLYPLLQPATLTAVYAHFPDPALLPKYRKRRLLNETFMDNVYRALVPGGTLSLVTDNTELFGILLALVEADPRFQKTHPERYLLGFEPQVKSRYQQYWEGHGVPIKRLEVRSIT